MTAQLRVGEVTISSIEEWTGTVGTAAELYPTSTPAEWEAAKFWLGREHWDPATDAIFATSRTFVVRSAGKTILIDTGIGNEKNRPMLPFFHDLHTDYLDQLTAAGVTPDAVDLIVCTHLHSDHVGWNTTRVDGQWIPTFPHAEILISQADFDSVNPDTGPAPEAAAEVFYDSIAPVAKAGQVTLWNDTHTIDENLTLETAAGHSPGMGIVKLASGGQRAVFVADLMHNPVQVPHSLWQHTFCEDAEAATVTRQRVLSWAADHDALVLPAHFCGSPAVEIERRGSRFSLRGVREFSA
jgi:glyoxylase-like metal-dependent hydrolase (beta-lactamase superfamily II)